MQYKQNEENIKTRLNKLADLFSEDLVCYVFVSKSHKQKIIECKPAKYFNEDLSIETETEENYIG